MKQDNTATMHFFWGLQLAGAAEMQPAGENPKVFSKKVGLFLASDTSDRFEDIMHDIIYSTKKSDFSDFLLGLSEKACDTGLRGQSFSIKNRKSQPLRPDFFEKDGEEAMIFSKKSKNLPSKRTFLLPTFHMCVWQGKENRSSGRKKCQDSLFSPAEINGGTKLHQTIERRQVMQNSVNTSPGSSPSSKFRRLTSTICGWLGLPKSVDSHNSETLFAAPETENRAESLILNVAPSTKPAVTSFLKSDEPHVSPHFIKGMKLGELMFAIAAVYAHAKRHDLACRIPWSYNQNTCSLRKLLNTIRIPGTTCGSNEPIAYRDPSMQYNPIPEDMTEGGLKGYFHSPRHFADMEDKIRKLFSPLIAEEKETGTVGIHINVGEGAFQHSKFRLATCYYLMRAAAYIPKEVRELTIFSETPAQAVAMLIDIPEFARFSFKPEHMNEIDSLRRMTEMERLITSNDAIAWWAAWLSMPTQVITSNFWYNVCGDKLSNMTNSSWIKL